MCLIAARLLWVTWIIDRALLFDSAWSFISFWLHCGLHSCARCLYSGSHHLRIMKLTLNCKCFDSFTVFGTYMKWIRIIKIGLILLDITILSTTFICKHETISFRHVCVSKSFEYPRALIICITLHNTTDSFRSFIKNPEDLPSHVTV